MEFAAAFAAAEAGEHAALAPVNTDTQAAQVPSAFLDDTEDVAAAKAAFTAAFEEAKSGGLAAKQAPAPVHEIVEAPLVQALPFNYAPHHFGANHLGYPLYPHAQALPHHAIPGFGLNNLPYNGLPYSGYNGLHYNGLGYNGVGYNSLGYNGLGHHGLGHHGLGYGPGLNGLGYHGLGYNGLAYQPSYAVTFPTEEAEE